jgi:hypothetical protein
MAGLLRLPISTPLFGMIGIVQNDMAYVNDVDSGLFRRCLQRNILWPKPLHLGFASTLPTALTFSAFPAGVLN